MFGHGSDFHEYSDLQNKADNGTAEEQYNVGKFFDDKSWFGGTRKAFTYYNKAATNGKGHAGAQYAVALIYTKGYDLGLGYKLEQSYEKSIIYFATAAHQGHAKAMRGIASSYRHGYGVAVNETIAQQWDAVSHDYNNSSSSTEVLPIGTRMIEQEFMWRAATTAATDDLKTPDLKTPDLKTLYKMLYNEITPNQ
jgi:hypothetical protein